MAKCHVGRTVLFVSKWMLKMSDIWTSIFVILIFKYDIGTEVI